MKTEQTFMSADRYVFDFGRCSYKNGFAQIDTAQDASYFGNWCSPTERVIVSYVEGDVTVQTADTDAEFVAALRDMAAWNDANGYGPTKIDAFCNAEMTARFEALGLKDMLH
jgi:hypothetical protein